MPLAAGRRVGPYEVVSPVGAGGMGEVYRARDSRLGRDVALKVLPTDRSGNPERLRRFEQEARAVAALNHPNILAVFDVGSEGGAPYVVFELLEGQTLRRRLGRGPLPARKAIEYAVQVCRGLSAAHAKGILHRDLKPENLFLTSDGQVKILDFGLAKLSEPAEASGLSEGETPTATDARALLGTVGYMSPEQVRGQGLDSRSDLFTLGAILYEMLSGRRAFKGETPADTLSAILSRDPQPLASTIERLPFGVERVVRRCLEKDAEERFQTARDLAFALEAVSDPIPAEVPVVGTARRHGRWARVGAAALVLLGAVTAAYLWGSRGSARHLLTYKQLTFRRGAVLDDARFTADGNTVVYSALWDGNPPETFTTRLDTPVSRSLGLPPARLLSVSSQGELAILLAKPGDRQGEWVGTLARVFAGGAPRELAGDVCQADWSPDGRELAVVRVVDGRRRLEYPIGHIVRDPFQADNWAFIRVSPQGDKVAAVGGAEGLLVIDRAGKARVVATPSRSLFGIVWDPRGGGLWTATGVTPPGGGAEALWYVPLDGKPTEVARMPAHLFLHDVSRDGRFLVHLGSEGQLIRAKASGETHERDLTVFDYSIPVAISTDGSQLLLGNEGGAFLRPMRGGEAVKLADDPPVALSVDSNWVLNAREDGSSGFILTSVGAAGARSMPSAGLLGANAGWFTDAGHVVFNAFRPGSRERAFVLDLHAGKPTPVTPEGVLAVPGSLVGGRIIAYGPDGSLAWYPLAGGEREPIAARVPEGAHPILASTDRRVLFVGEDGVPGRIDHLDLATGQRIPWKTLRPEDPVGVFGVSDFRVTPDGQAYAYGYMRNLQDLYVVEGPRWPARPASSASWNSPFTADGAANAYRHLRFLQNPEVLEGLR
ncbi:MAG TPA: serine/threonine-protein kinase [Vicinamibacteria bacterium]|nr:serine/threonine-protein kinase [Vicinamibacteria bacterium]